MTTIINQTPNLDKLANHLRESFAFLCISVKNALKAKSVHLDDAKLFIRMVIDDKLDKQKKAFHESLKKIQNFDEFFDCLHCHRFLGYLNYDLLKSFAKLAKDEDINKMFDEYEKEYIKFLKDSSSSEILSLFHQYPNLKPAAVIGLPQVGFHCIIIKYLSLVSIG